jgi:TonB family protein
LDYHHKEVLITIQSYIKKNSNSNLSFYLLAISAMMLLSCSSNNDKGEAGQKESIALVSDATVQIKKPDSSLAEDDHRMDSLLPGELSLVGDLVIDDSLLVNDPQYRTVSGVRIFAEVMPEFIGGVDSLMAYFGQNLVYPEWEKKAGIEGNAFVSFTVDENGKVVDPRVIRSVSGSRNFDSEVLRLMNEMPRWKPGKQNGKNVAVQMVLPIKFKL